jgi:arginine-tRNA-protein transferase
MLDTDVCYINEAFNATHVGPARQDLLLAEAWRHFGTYFFRYNWAFYGLDIRRVIPLRIRLSNFLPTKSQRRVIRKNRDLRTIIRPANITRQIEELFQRHKRRFTQGVPDTIYDFLSHDPANIPCRTMELAVYESDDLVAVSYFDVGETSTSGIYAMFEPRESSRRLGIFTMLKEIEFSIESNKMFYYQGYAYEGESFYDYKKRFSGTEAFNWSGDWKPLDLEVSSGDRVQKDRED